MKGRSVPGCEMIAIGNELLQGDVLDTNTHWLIQQITALGGHVERAVMVRMIPRPSYASCAVRTGAVPI